MFGIESKSFTLIIIVATIINIILYIIIQLIAKKRYPNSEQMKGLYKNVFFSLLKASTYAVLFLTLLYNMFIVLQSKGIGLEFNVIFLTAMVAVYEAIDYYSQYKLVHKEWKVVVHKERELKHNHKQKK